jgi:hypothetical protein
VFLGELGKGYRAIAYAFDFFHLAQFRAAAALNWVEPLATESLAGLLGRERAVRQAAPMPRAKTFSIKMADLPSMVDAIFAGDHDDPGWVEMSANDKGRACVDALFPGAHIEWREPGTGAPADWLGFVISIPDVVAEMDTALALAITRCADLGETNPDALALLLAMGVMRQGGRAAYFREGQIEMVLPHSGH